MEGWIGALWRCGEVDGKTVGEGPSRLRNINPPIQDLNAGDGINTVIERRDKIKDIVKYVAQPKAYHYGACKLHYERRKQVQKEITPSQLSYTNLSLNKKHNPHKSSHNSEENRADS